MRLLTMDYDLAFAIGKDAANARMRKAGRHTWDEEDYNACVDAFYACFGTTPEQYHADIMAGKPDPIPPRTAAPMSAALCPIHHVPLTCAACSGRKGGQVSSPKKTRAARANAKLPRRRKRLS